VRRLSVIAPISGVAGSAQVASSWALSAVSRFCVLESADCCCSSAVMLTSTVSARSSERCTAAARARSALASERSSVVRSAPNTTPATHSSSTANIM
jgi:hypothetical protein